MDTTLFLKKHKRIWADHTKPVLKQKKGFVKWSISSTRKKANSERCKTDVVGE